MVRKLLRWLYRSFLEPEVDRRKREMRDCDHSWVDHREYTKSSGIHPGNEDDTLLIRLREYQDLQCEHCGCVQMNRVVGSKTYRVSADAIAENEYDDPVFYHA